MPRYDAVIFDLGGVFTQPQRSDKVRELMTLLGTAMDEGSFREAYAAPRLDYDRGVIGADGYWRQVALGSGAKAGRPPLDGGWSALLPRLIEVDIEGWFEIRPGMVELARRVKAELGRVALLSNINRECADHLDARHPWIKIFDTIVYSCDHRLLKPERAIYELCLARLGLSAARCIFVDDREDNVVGARSTGIHGIRFDDEPSLRRDLARATGLGS